MTTPLLELPPQARPSVMNQPDVSLLEDRVPPQLQSSRRLAACVLGFGLIFAWNVLNHSGTPTSGATSPTVGISPRLALSRRLNL